MNGSARSKAGLGPLQYSHSGSLTTPLAGLLLLLADYRPSPFRSAWPGRVDRVSHAEASKGGAAAGASARSR
jgi:hypothetical protein